MVVADHLGALELRLRYPLHLCVIAHPRFAVNVRESRLRRRLVRVLLASCTSYVLCCDQVCGLSICAYDRGDQRMRHVPRATVLSPVP